MTRERHRVLTGEEEAALAAEARRIFGTRLGMARIAVYSDQDQAGKVLGFKKRRWGGYEGGRREPPLWFLRQLPGMFHRPLSWFFDLPDERELNEQEGKIISVLRSIQNPVVRDRAGQLAITVLEGELDLDLLFRGQPLSSVER